MCGLHNPLSLQSNIDGGCTCQVLEEQMRRGAKAGMTISRKHRLGQDLAAQWLQGGWVPLFLGVQVKTPRRADFQKAQSTPLQKQHLSNSTPLLRTSAMLLSTQLPYKQDMRMPIACGK